MSVGKFSKLRGKTRKSGIGVGTTKIDLNTGDNTGRSDVLPVNHNIGEFNNPKKRYNRKSEVKSAGGYIVAENTEKDEKSED